MVFALDWPLGLGAFLMLVYSYMTEHYMTWAHQRCRLPADTCKQAQRGGVKACCCCCCQVSDRIRAGDLQVGVSNAAGVS